MLRNLLSMAAADGSLTEREIKFLASRAERWGVAEHDFAAAVEFALSHPGELKIPGGKDDGIELLTNLVQMMAADGELSPAEKRMFATAAAYMEITPDELNSLIDRLLG